MKRRLLMARAPGRCFGASPCRCYGRRHFFVVVLSIIGGYQVFVEPFILYTGGAGPGDGGLTLALLIYRTAFTSFHFGTAAAMGVILALIILGLFTHSVPLFWRLGIRTNNRWQHKRASSCSRPK